MRSSVHSQYLYYLGQQYNTYVFFVWLSPLCYCVFLVYNNNNSNNNNNNNNNTNVNV